MTEHLLSICLCFFNSVFRIRGPRQNQPKKIMRNVSTPPLMKHFNMRHEILPKTPHTEKPVRLNGDNCYLWHLQISNWWREKREEECKQWETKINHSPNIHWWRVHRKNDMNRSSWTHAPSSCAFLACEVWGTWGHTYYTWSPNWHRDGT